MGKTFEAAMDELDGIVKRLEDGTLTLDESIKEFTSGMALIKECRDTLTNARQKVVRIMSDGKTEEFGENSDE